MSFLVVEGLRKAFGNNLVLNNINFEVQKGKLFSIVGPSGCGKTTLLRILAGLEKPDKGKIILDGIDITNYEPQKRNVGIVFQNYALFPNMNVYENIAYGLKIKKIEKSLIDRKVNDILEKVKLTEKIFSPVYSLSGGEQQRVSLARVIVNEPKLILFDEPLSNLDYLLRVDTRAEIKRMQYDSEITSIYVTHDQTEALSLSDELIVLNKGAIMQKGEPSEIYNSPGNRFTAEFISHSNIFNKEESKFLIDFALNDQEILSVLPEGIILEHNSESEIFISEILFNGMFTEYILKYKNKFFKSVSLSEDYKKFKINDKVLLKLKENKFKVLLGN